MTDKPATPHHPPFDYEKTFDRNLGWLTSDEQSRLRNSSVAIAGLGGAGGFQAQALARLGVGHFRIADPDCFEITNINRQIGASYATLGRRKTDVIREMILDINPEAKVEVFSEGINEGNIEAFLQGTGLAVDGIDFFAFDAKLLFFEKCRSLGITALTSCPLGFGASLILFSPQGMSFEKYLDLRPGMSDHARRFAVAFGLSPSPLCLGYMNKKATELGEGRAASVCPGLMLVGALTAAEAVKVLTGKGRPRYAPHVYQTDLFTGKTVRKYYLGGMAHPWMRLKKWAVLNFFLPSNKAA